MYLAVKLLFPPTLLSLHVFLTPNPVYSLASVNVITQHCQPSLHLAQTERGPHLSSGGQEKHRPKKVNRVTSGVATLLYFSISYILKAFIHN